MATARAVAHNLAAAWLAGTWTRRGLLARARAVLGDNDAVLRTLVSEVMAAVLLEPTSPQHLPQMNKEGLLLPMTRWPADGRWLIRFLLLSTPFRQAHALARAAPPPAPQVLASPAFLPSPRFAGLAVPALCSAGAVADLLGISTSELDWFADSHRQQRTSDHSALQHYAVSFIAKAQGPPRLLEQPKARLKTLQRQILRDILAVVPVHPDAHGFVAGRSCLGAAALHAGEAVVVSADLKDFFLTTPIGRVHGLFRSLGYPPAVARLLTGLSTTATPLRVFQRLPAEQRHNWLTQKLFASPHLPQGAPTSPALANLAAFQLDVRLAGLARHFGARFSRYADDIAFSGGPAFAGNVAALLRTVATIATDEGYCLNAAKTRVMPNHRRQQVVGLIVNRQINVAREDFDDLKAILHNCRKRGAAAENRQRHADFRAHLDGRVGWVECVNPLRGRKLRSIYDEISWNEQPADAC